MARSNRGAHASTLKLLGARCAHADTGFAFSSTHRRQRQRYFDRLGPPWGGRGNSAVPLAPRHRRVKARRARPPLFGSQSRRLAPELLRQSLSPHSLLPLPRLQPQPQLAHFSRHFHRGSEPPASTISTEPGAFIIGVFSRHARLRRPLQCPLVEPGRISAALSTLPRDPPVGRHRRIRPLHSLQLRLSQESANDTLVIDDAADNSIVRIVEHGVRALSDATAAAWSIERDQASGQTRNPCATVLPST